MPMQLIQGHFNGTGADVYLQLGSIPYSIKLWNLDISGGTIDTMEWSRVMGSFIDSTEGLTRVYGGGAVVDHTVGEGIQPYHGGELLTTVNQTNVAYGGGIYIERDDKDYRFYTNEAAGILGDASTEDITTWTLDNSSTYRGNFNGDVVGTYIGAGSEIRIVDSNNKHTYETWITTDLSTAGDAASEVYLAYPVPSGDVGFIGGKHGYIPTAIGKVTKSGILLGYSTFNVNDDRIAFEALCPG